MDVDLNSSSTINKMDNDEFNGLLRVLRKFSKVIHKLNPNKEFQKKLEKQILREGLNIYGISHEFRPAYLYATTNNTNESGICNLETFFEENNLNLSTTTIPNTLAIGGVMVIIYNTSLINKKNPLKPIKNEDDGQFLGRIFGYPEIFSGQELKSIKGTKFSVHYELKFRGESIPILEFISRRNCMDFDIVENTRRVYTKLGISTLEVKSVKSIFLGKVTDIFEGEEIEYNDYECITTEVKISL